MSKLTIFTLIMLVTVIVWGEKENKSKAKNRYCTYYDELIKEGQTRPGPIGRCEQVKCTKATSDNQTIALSLSPCPIYPPKPTCWFGEINLTKRYPDCCPKQLCFKAKESSN